MIEFGSKKATVILGRLQVCRACAYTSIALRVAHPAGSGASPHLYPAFSGTAQALSRSAAGLPCFFEVRSADNRIQHTVASGFAEATPDKSLTRRSAIPRVIFLFFPPESGNRRI